MEFLKFALDNLQIVIFFGGLIVGWVRMENVVGSMVERSTSMEKKFETELAEVKLDTQKDIGRLESRMAVQEKLNQTIREDIASIKAVMENTGHNISDIRRVLERLDERLHRT